MLDIAANVLWIGIGGALMIAAAWSYEMWEAVERHKKLVDLRFAGIYLIGTILLFVYSWLKADIVFTSINAALSLLVMFEIAYTMGWKFGRVGKRRK